MSRPSAAARPTTLGTGRPPGIQEKAHDRITTPWREGQAPPLRTGTGLPQGEIDARGGSLLSGPGGLCARLEDEDSRRLDLPRRGQVVLDRVGAGERELPQVVV